MDTSASAAPIEQRHGRETGEFARVVNLSDAVFAIAITVLVLTIDVPDVPAAELAEALIRELPQLGAYVLAFVLIASQWIMHHKLFHRLAFVERGLTFINLAYLGLVALVPFPTGVFGAHPTSTAAVAPFLTLFVVINLVAAALIMRAEAVGAWTEPLPPGIYSRTMGAFLAGVVALLLGIFVSVWVPLAAVAMVAVSGVPFVLVMRGAPAPYRAWI